MGTMTIEQFGAEVKKKYPQYKDIDDATLGQQVLEKYPQYQRALSVDKPSSVSPAEATQRSPRNNLLTNIAKPFIKTAAAVPALIGGVSKLAQGDVAGASDALTRERSFGMFGSTRPIGINQETGQKQSFGELAKDVIGTGAEIASYAAPVGALGRGASLGAKITSAGKAGAVGGAIGGLGSGLQQDQTLGKTLGQTATGALAGGAVGGLLPVGGATVRKAGNLVGRLGSEVLGKTTGAGEAAIREAFNNPNVVRFARNAGKEGPEGLMKQALEEAHRGLDNLTSSNSKAYNEAMSRIIASPQDLSGAVSELRRSIVQNATDGFGIRFGDGKKLNNLDFNASDIVQGSAEVQRAFDRLFGEPIGSVKELDRVKKSLGRIAKGAPHGSPAQALIFQMKDEVSNILKTKIPGYAEEMGRFSEAIELTDEIEKALSLSDKASQDTAVRKLMSSMRQNNELRNAMLEMLGKGSNEDILGKIAGATLAPMTPRALTGILQPTAIGFGGLSGIINASNIPYLILYLSSTSPRAVAEFMNLLGKVKGKVIPPKIQAAMKNILIQAARGATESETNP